MIRAWRSCFWAAAWRLPKFSPPMPDHLNGATRLFPVVGDPIAQVQSPAGVTRAFQERGLNAICIPMQIAPAEWQGYIATMRAMKNVDGFIVTIPHKFAAFESCDTVSERAQFLRTVNTIRKMPDGSLHGDMFDGLGFVEACRANGCVFEGRRALLVGTGGAGTAIAHAVALAGVAHLTQADIDTARRDDLVSRLQSAGFYVSAGSNDATGMDIVLNATPMGMRPDDPLPVMEGSLRAGQFVGDVVTKPEVPRLIAEARAIGLATSNGFAMFEKVRDLMVAFLTADIREET
ncbi:MAG: shikimate dehydrogenase family protein [Beijerinckiaceae bacterium]